MRSTLFVCLVSLLIHSCGSDGQGKQRVQPPRPEIEEPEIDAGLGLRTSVGLNPLSYEFPFLTSCLRRVEGSNLVKLASGWTANGLFEEWLDATGIDDPAGDADGAEDLAKVYIGANDDKIGAAIYVTNPLTATVRIEFGGIVVNKKSLQPEVLRVVELNSLGNQELRAGVWQPVSSNDVEVVRTEAGLELSIARRFLGETIAHPAWWVRVIATKNEAFDSTYAAYFPNLIASDAPDFEFLGCKVWTTQPKPFSMYYLQDAAGVNPGYAMRTVAERAFQLARLAYDAVHDLDDEVSLPMSATTVIATLANTDPLIKKLAGADEAADLFGSLRINVGSLGPDSVDAFPQGRIFSQSVMFFLDAYLYKINSNLPPLLRLAVARALLDKAQIKFLTPAYYLDYFGTDTDAFIKHFNKEGKDTVGSLATADYDNKLARQKALALGNLLAIMTQTKDLIHAWQATAGSSDPESFKQALNAFLPDPKDQDPWAGWLSVAAYTPGYSPKVLQDTDFDGLPDALEVMIGSDATMRDTDKDGWSDYSEWLLGNDADHAGDWPKVVVPDGLFSDWFTLFPQRVHADKGGSGACPDGADITHFAALATQDQLVIAAHAKNYDPNDPKSMWQAMINSPLENKSILVSAEGRSRKLNVKDPVSGKILRRFQRAMPMGNDTVEWVIDRRDFGFTTYFDRAEGIRVQIVTGYEDEKDGSQFCDQTEWFSPYVYEKG